MTPLRLCLCVAFLSAASFFSNQPAAAAPNQAPIGNGGLQLFDRTRFPEALKDVPLERLSSGALLRLDRDGDLVESPAAFSARLQQKNAAARTGGHEEDVIIALDPRVASNLRLGDDPPALPANFRAQAEPHITRAPNDPDFLVATFQEGRFVNGGAVDCGYSVSHDGGLSWTRALIPNLTTASGGTYDRATDPVAGADHNGFAYLNTLGLRNGQVSDGTVLVSRSVDGGNTWGNPLVAYQPPNTSLFPDKNWMAVNSFANTASSGRVVVTFTLFSNTGGRAAPIMRVLSDNGGTTWSGAAFVHPANYEVQGSQPVFLPDGKLAIIYWNFNATDDFGDDFLEAVVSNDGGVTFGSPKFITNVNIYDHPNVRDGAFLPSGTTDRTTGHLYVVYQARLNGAPRVLFTKSTDAGTTWSAPIPISDNPAAAGVLNPAIAASADGQTLTAAFYSSRDNPGSNTLLDMYLAQSFDGGATWQPNIRLTDVSSDAALAPLTGAGYMLGDYLGIAESTNANVPAVPVWVDTRTGNPDPFVARVGIAPAFDFTSWQAGRLSSGQINNPATGGEAGDADGDGENNQAEFLAGTDPNDPASVPLTGRQLNLATRARVGNGDESALIGGFIITGTASKRVIVRAIGPSLTGRGVPGAMQNPTLELVPATGSPIFNDDWRTSDAGTIQATGVPPEDDREAAIVQTLAPGLHTAIVRGLNNAAGVALIEVYDLDPTAAPKLANISSRGFVGVNDDAMIAGLIVGRGQGTNGAGSVRVLVRGIGPSLAARGITAPLLNPELFLYNSNGDVLATNNDWREAQEAEIAATGIPPENDREAAILVTLVQGTYTALLRGIGGTTGVGLVESYEVN